MTIATIRERLHEYIDFADEKKVNAIYTMVEDEIVEENVTRKKVCLNMKNVS